MYFGPNVGDLSSKGGVVFAGTIPEGVPGGWSAVVGSDEVIGCSAVSGGVRLVGIQGEVPFGRSV